MNRREFLAATAAVATLPILAPRLARAAVPPPSEDRLAAAHLDRLKMSLERVFPMRRAGLLWDGPDYVRYLEVLSTLEDHGVMTTETPEGLLFKRGTPEQVARHAMYRRATERQLWARIRYKGDRRRFLGPTGP